jgi:1-phosphofructokinase family hexose kinase
MNASPPIVAVCLNPAVDVTYPVHRLIPDSSHRVTGVLSRAGGKGLNVARVLRQLGADATVLGLAGGASGARVADELAHLEVPAHFTRIAGETRRTVTVLSGDEATVFNEAGPQVTAAEWDTFRSDFADRTGGARMVVLSGSVPPGVPETAYAELTGLARRNGATVLVDATGPLLRHALTAEPDVVKPNAHEVGDLVGVPVRTRDGAVTAARELIGRGARIAVVSRGAAGFVAVTPDLACAVGVSERVPGNPTGAGDALAAVLALGLACRDPWLAVLSAGAAVSAAAVACSQAGEFDADVADWLRPGVTVDFI